MNQNRVLTQTLTPRPLSFRNVDLIFKLAQNAVSGGIGGLNTRHRERGLVSRGAASYN
jgi:hypothetical protein